MAVPYPKRLSHGVKTRGVTSKAVPSLVQEAEESDSWSSAYDLWSSAYDLWSSVRTESAWLLLLQIIIIPCHHHSHKKYKCKYGTIQYKIRAGYVIFSLKQDVFSHKLSVLPLHHTFMP